MSDAPAQPPREPGSEENTPPPEATGMPLAGGPYVVPPPEPEPEPERDPFWGYSDVLLFMGLAIPSLLLGGALATWILRGAQSAFNVHPKIPALMPLGQQFGGDLILFGALAAILRLQYNRPFWRSLGWTRMRLPFFLIVSSGLACALGVALLGALIRIPTTANPMTELMQDHASAILMAIFGTTIAPLTEELAFRGFLQPLLVRSLGALPGIVLAAIAFGLLHYREYGNSWRHAILIALAGSAFGWMRHATGSTRASAIMHAAYNGVIFYVVFAHPQ